AGTNAIQAGAYAPFAFTLTRDDPQQEYGRIEARLPPGLLPIISGIPLCAEPLIASGTCGAQSLIGHVLASIGPGPHPFYLPGSVYITGPYEGEPYGLVVVVPAIAGPFNLGTIVVRAGVGIDPTDAHLRISSQPLPRIVDGIPLQVKTVSISIDRPDFMFNPTGCGAKGVGGTIGSAEGLSADVSSPFQVSGCAALGFAPKLKVSTAGHTSRGNGASLRIRLLTKGGPSANPNGPIEANMRRFEVNLPRLLPARLTTLQQACPEALFEQNPAACPHGSDVGFAKAATPILATPLQGPVYLVSHGGQKYPELVAVLQGAGVTLEVGGRTEIRSGVTYSRFESIPDAPLKSFELTLPQGPHSALSANATRLCGRRLTMPTLIEGQNGALIKETTRIAITGCKHRHSRAKKTLKPGPAKKAGGHRRAVAKK
ncbi:MAG TPA: hypothetical protein VGX16_07880, partial [Solirubrobacteraceae bacterium]|nr:hypothetical protein [Solirubrobacteraceae bacterium]